MWTQNRGAVSSGSTLFASILNSSVMLGNYLQQTTSSDDIFRCIFSWRLRVNAVTPKKESVVADQHELYLKKTLPSKHTTLKQCRINVDATSWRHIDVDTTLFDVMCLLGLVV